MTTTQIFVVKVWKFGELRKFVNILYTYALDLLPTKKIYRVRQQNYTLQELNLNPR